MVNGLPLVPVVCIDEWKGHRAALAVGLKAVGVLGFLGKAKLLGLVPAVRPFLENALKNGIRYDPELVRQILENLGEAPLIKGD